MFEETGHPLLTEVRHCLWVPWHVSVTPALYWRGLVVAGWSVGPESQGCHLGSFFVLLACGSVTH